MVGSVAEGGGGGGEGCYDWSEKWRLVFQQFFYRMNEALQLSIFLKHTFQKDNFYRYVTEMFLFCRVS